jgi:hypothetical protein
MALKYKYQNQAEIPADVAAHYIEREGAWVQDCDGGVDKTKLDEIRQTNINLTRQLDEQKRRFDGIDPDAVREAMEAKRRIDEGEFRKNGDFEAALQSRVSPIEKRAKEAEALAARTNALLLELQIDPGAVAAATKRGLAPTAIADLTARARSAFRLVNGAPVAVEADGQTPRLGKDGVSSMSFDEWADTLAAEAPHLFERNSGGGAAGSGSSGAGNGFKNPWRKESWNLTEQMKLIRSDPKQAEQLKASAKQ